MLQNPRDPPLYKRNHLPFRCEDKSRWASHLVVGGLEVVEVRLADAGDVDSRSVDWDDGAILGLESGDVGLAIVVVEEGDASSWDAGDGHGES